MPLNRKGVTEQTRQQAIGLRKRATEPEKVLWSILRSRQIASLKFRRQHPIEQYIVDFYCASCSLVVEVDGESHDGRQEYDSRREHRLKQLGLEVIRVSNDDVMENLEGVAEFIAQTACRRKAPPLTPPQQTGAGD